MASTTVPRGVHLPIVTPLTPAGEVDLACLEALVTHYLDAGIDGIVALGTTGEPSTLDDHERREIVQVCARLCAERGRSLLVGPGSNSTAATIAHVQSLAGIDGVTGALCVVPYYTLPGQEGVIAHFEAVATQSPVPIVLYNFPSRTGQPLDPDSVLRLARHPRIVAIKQSTPLDLSAIRVLAETPPDFAVLCGDDTCLFPATLLGGAGVISALAHVCTDRVLAMIAAALQAKVEEGRSHHEALLPVVAACFPAPGPAVLKGVLHAQGLLSSPGVRLPILEASAAAVESALHAIAAATGTGAMTGTGATGATGAQPG